MEKWNKTFCSRLEPDRLSKVPIPSLENRPLAEFSTTWNSHSQKRLQKTPMKVPTKGSFASSPAAQFQISSAPANVRKVERIFGRTERNPLITPRFSLFFLLPMGFFLEPPVFLTTRSFSDSIHSQSSPVLGLPASSAANCATSWSLEAAIIQKLKFWR